MVSWDKRQVGGGGEWGGVGWGGGICLTALLHLHLLIIFTILHTDQKSRSWEASSG